MSFEIICNNELEKERAEGLAKQFSGQILTDITQASADFLFILDDKLSLSALVQDQYLNICVDFNSETMKWWQTSIGKKHPLAKSIGIKSKKAPLTVIDGTAGMGKDSYLMAYLGCSVTMLEASPIIAELLADGINRISDSAIKEAIQFYSIDCIHYLKQLERTQYPDVIYLDPMFPTTKKSAKVKKEMQVLQHIEQTTCVEKDLLQQALVCAKMRVVVKRPKSAPPINDQKPSFVIQSKTLRYDIYSHLEND